MRRELYVGESIKIRATVKDKDGEVFDPDIVTIAAVAPSGAETIHSTDDGNVYLDTTGIYLSYFNADEAGVWVISLKIEYDENGETITEREEMRYKVLQKAGT